MSVEAVISTQVIDTTSVGRSLMTAADAAAARTAADAQVTLVSGTNIKTVNSTSLLGSGDIAVGVSGTGSVDNAALRADGTGGATLQTSAFVIADNATASPNNTVNHASLSATGTTTDVSVSIKPKGAGAFSLAVPDATATGGNVRGTNAADLQTLRSAAAQVASGAYSFVACANNTASGSYSAAVGYSNTASGGGSFAAGYGNSVTGNWNAVFGYANTVTGGSDGGCFATGKSNTITVSASTTAFVVGYLNSVISDGGFGHGTYGVTRRLNQYTHGALIRGYAGPGVSQFVRIVVGNKTTDATPTRLVLDTTATGYPSVASGTAMFLTVDVIGIKSDGSAAACYKRKVAIKNVGGTTSLIGSVETIGTDIEDNAATAVAITEDNTNDAIDISVTGIAAETWRWVAVIEGLEIAYGT